MTSYCENANRAIVTFALAYGGREGQIISYDPPVSVGISSGRIVRIFRDSVINDFEEEIPWGVFPPGSDMVFETFLSDEDGWELKFFKRYPLPGQPWGYGIARNFIYYPEAEQSYPEEFLFWEEEPAFGYNIHHFSQLRKTGAFTIRDKTGILYSYDYPEGITPVWNVDCFSCPSGTKSIQGSSDIVCIDVEKVINGLNKARTKLRNYGSK